MTTIIIIAICSLLLIAYIFDLTSRRTKIPSVIPLLILGWLAQQITGYYDITLPDLTPVLSIFGTVGLILIVLEGSLELEITKSRRTLSIKSFIIALLPLVAMAVLVSYLFVQFGGYSFRESLINAIPFCIISSAIAIPSVSSLSKENKEFVIYETSFSDILGVIFFNFVAFNSSFDTSSIGIFILQMGIILAITIISTISLSYLLKNIDHHVKFLPIILLVVLIYAASKEFHLPGLIFILLFGLFLGNLEKIKKIKFLHLVHTEIIQSEIIKFKDIIIEFTFIIRALFFLLFGYLIDASELFEMGSVIWAIIITIFIYTFRFITLKVTKIPVNPFIFIAPRGLITILLFLSIATENTIPIVNKPLIIQVIIITVIVMMFGIMNNKIQSETAEDIQISAETKGE